MTWIRVAALVLVLAVEARGQAPRELPRPGVYPTATQDSVVLAGGKNDTSVSFPTYGVDIVGFWGYYKSRNDSTNLVVRLDFSPDNKHWLKTVTIDSVVTSGAADSMAAERIDTFPDWAYFARCRVNSSAAATDTVDTFIWYLLHYMAKPRLP